MAKETPPAPPAEVKPKNRMKLLVIFLVIVLFVVVVGAAVVVLLLSGKSHSNNNSDDGNEEEVVQEDDSGNQDNRRNPNAPPMFSELDDFVVNLLPDPPPPPPPSTPGSGMMPDNTQQPAAPYYEDGLRYLQVKIVLELDAKDADTRIKAQMPRIRNNVTVLLSNKTAKGLATKDGKDALAEEIMNEINGIIVPPVKGKRQSGPVVAVLFTSFLIQ